MSLGGDFNQFRWTAVRGDVRQPLEERQEGKNDQKKARWRFPFGAFLRNIRALLINTLCIRQGLLLQLSFR